MAGSAVPLQGVASTANTNPVDQRGARPQASCRALPKCSVASARPDVEGNAPCASRQGNQRGQSSAGASSHCAPVARRIYGGCARLRNPLSHEIDDKQGCLGSKQSAGNGCTLTQERTGRGAQQGSSPSTYAGGTSGRNALTPSWLRQGLSIRVSFNAAKLSTPIECSARLQDCMSDIARVHAWMRARSKLLSKAHFNQLLDGRCRWPLLKRPLRLRSRNPAPPSPCDLWAK
jgi:hypothetical protein